MKSLTRYLTMNIPARMDFVNITGEVREAVREYADRHEARRIPRSLGAGRSGRRNLGERAEALLKGMGNRR